MKNKESLAIELISPINEYYEHLLGYSTEKTQLLIDNDSRRGNIYPEIRLQLFQEKIN